MIVPEFLRKRGIKQILTLDWETYYSVHYTLKQGKYQYSTSEYVRDKQFKAHGVGIRTNTRKNASWITDLTKLDQIDWSITALLAHHTQFDGLILTHHFKHTPAYWLDTLSMARVWIDHSVGNSLDAVASYYGLGNKLKDVLEQCKGIRDLPPALCKLLGDYCKQDVNLTAEIFGIMWEEGFPISELDLIDLTIRMFTEPVLKVDKPLAKEELERVLKHNELMIRNTASYFRIPRSIRGEERMEEARKTLTSDLKLATALKAMGVDVPMKITAKGNEKPAFAKNDLAFLELQMHPDRRVRKVCEARLVVKSSIDEAKARRLLDHADPALPIYLGYGRAHTTRWGGGDLLNPQNFRRGGVLRRCIRAPRGQQLVVVDSGQIEARVVAWLAGQWDLLEVFADPKRDPYCEYASELFGHKVTKKNKTERFVGKVGVLSLGFQSGWAKFQHTLASGAMGMKVNISETQAQDAVIQYRQKNDKIVRLWKTLQNMLYVMERDDTRSLKDGLIEFGLESVSMPNGLSLSYPKLKQKRTFDNMGDGFWYWNGKFFTKIYGGLFTENCIAESTEVFTDSGWKQIQDIAQTDKIHDGIEFVTHRGLLFKSVQSCITIDGVWMTPDHEVLTDEGWKAASQSPRPYRPNLWIFKGLAQGFHRWEKMVMGLRVHTMWSKSCTSRRRYKQKNKAGTNPKLWLCFTNRKKQNSRHDQTSSVCSMAINARSLQITFAPSMAQLRSTWNTCMQTLAKLVPEFLGGHGANVQNRTYYRTPKQQRTLFSQQLRVDNSARTKQQPPQQCLYKHSMGEDDNKTSFKEKRCKKYNTNLSHIPQLASEQVVYQTSSKQSRVYDIINCGPRHRFVVRGNEGPFIVHNCVQCLARIIVANQMLEIAEKYRVVMMTHDEAAYLAPTKQAEAALEFGLKIFQTSKDWYSNIPLSAEGGYSIEYSK